MAIGEKLAALLKAKNKKPGTLASETGISKNTIYSIIKRNNEKVNYSIMEKIAAALDVPVEYFFPSNENKSPFDYEGVRPVSVRRVPLLGGAACGEPIYAPGDGTEFLTVDGSVPCDFALVAEGDSMIGDRIHDGDTVFFQSVNDVRDGEIAAVAVDDGVSIKHISRVLAPDGSVLFTQLLSSNPKYQPITIGGEDETRIVRILGRAVSFSGKLNEYR